MRNLQSLAHDLMQLKMDVENQLENLKASTLY